MVPPTATMTPERFHFPNAANEHNAMPVSLDASRPLSSTVFPSLRLTAMNIIVHSK